MKTKILLGIIASISIFLTSCDTIGNKIRPSGKVVSREHTVTDYSGLVVSNAFEVYLNFSSTNHSIEIEADDNLHSVIEVFKSGDNLVIKLNNNASIRGNSTLRAIISCDYLSDIEASGASNIDLRNTLITNKLYLNLSGASLLSGTVDVGEAISEISGASVLNLSGNVDYLNIDASGASALGKYDLSIDHLDAELSGASDANITVNNRIDIDASGASTLTYKGDAVIQHQDLSGSSSVNKVR